MTGNVSAPMPVTSIARSRIGAVRRVAKDPWWCTLRSNADRPSPMLELIGETVLVGADPAATTATAAQRSAGHVSALQEEQVAPDECPLDVMSTGDG